MCKNQKNKQTRQKRNNAATHKNMLNDNENWRIAVQNNELGVN